MMRKPKVIVAIPACNEEANIGQLVRELLEQRRDNFVFKSLWVVSDGSSDRTVERVKGISNTLVKITEGRVRKSKIRRTNEIFSKFEGDILITLDADIRLSDRRVISLLVATFQKNKHLDLVFGTSEVVKPANFVERLAYFGYEVWVTAVKLVGDPPRYYSNGQIRAFTRNFISGFRLPERRKDISEDIYIFYHAALNGYKIAVSKKAKVYYKLPSTLWDYVAQMKRFLRAPFYMDKYYGRQAVKKFEVITNKVRFKALLIVAVKSPFIAFCYLVLQAYTRFLATFSEPEAAWKLASSSKNFNESNQVLSNF